jgi:hypothetical protein
MNIGIQLKYGVVVRPTVMRGDKVVREYPLQNNLITDIGLEKLATTWTTDCFATAAVGTGTTAANWADTTLETYVKSSETYKQRDVGNGDFYNGYEIIKTPDVDTLIKRYRTFIFTTETSSVTYNEGGWSWEAASVSNPLVFGRIKFAAPINLAAGEYLLLYVELRTWIDSTVATIPSLPITGLAVPAHAQHQQTETSIGEMQGDYINSDGTGYHYAKIGTGADIEPCNSIDSNEDYPLTPAAVIVISEDNTALGDDEKQVKRYPLAGQALGFVSIVAAEPYVALSHQYVYVFEALASDTGAGDVDLTNNWWDIRFANGEAYGSSGYRIRFDAVQSKTAANNVKLVFTKSWTRL